MTVVTLTTTNAAAQTWTVPSILTAGATITVESWGAGSGGSGGNTSNRAGGAGSAYATSTYTVSPNDVTNGISYLLKAGGAGSAGANSTVGPDTSWSTNNINIVPQSTLAGVALGVIGSGGALPTGWYQEGSGTTVSVVGFGYTTVASADSVVGLPYVDVRFNGTVSGNNWIMVAACPRAGQGQNVITAVASTQYTASFYLQSVAGSFGSPTNTIGDIERCASNVYTGDQSIVVGNPPPATLTRYNGSITLGVGDNGITLWWYAAYTGGTVIDFTVRLAGWQIEAAASTSFFKTTPGYCLAKGGSATSGTTGGVGGLASACVPTTGAFNGGSGATRTQGGGGGGSAGPQGAGGSSTTGTGGTGDNGSGGAANTSNILGGGGATAGNPAGTPGDPGGGGGANTSTGTGTTGGRGQIRLTFLGTFTPNILDAPLRQRVEMIAY